MAELYNELYRKGKRSQYTERNVCICGGGRASLTRAVAALGEVNLGHFLPDYTAYEELLDIFKLFTSIPILLEGADRLPLRPRGAASGRSPVAGSPRCCSPTPATRPARSSRATSSTAGSGSRASWAAPC